VRLHSLPSFRDQRYSIELVLKGSHGDIASYTDILLSPTSVLWDDMQITTNCSSLILVRLTYVKWALSA